MHIQDVNENCAQIQIFHKPAKQKGMLTYCRKLRLDDNFSIQISSEQEEIVKESVEVIFSALQCNDRFNPDI